MALIEERPDREGPWPWWLALAPSVAIFFGGLNSPFGAGVTALGYGALLVAQLWRDTPPMRFWRRAWPALLLLAAAWGWAAIGVAGMAGASPVAPDLGASALIGLWGYGAALACGAVAGVRRIRLATFLDAMLAFGAVSLLVALALEGNLDVPWTDWTDPFTGRFLGTLDNANAAGAVYALLATFALARAVALGGAPWRASATLGPRFRALGYALAFLLFAGGCVLTASRSGVVLGLLGFAAIGVAAYRTRARRVLIPALLVGLLLLGLVGLLLADQLHQRFDQLPDEASVRLLLWRHNLDVAWQYPLFGQGVGAFPVVNARSLADVRTAQAIWMTNSPHDIALRLMIDAGLPYLLLIVAAASVIAWGVAHAARGRRLDLHETALVAGIGIILGSSLVDIALEVPALAALTMVCAGLLWGRALARHADVRVAGAHFRPAPAE